MGLSLLFHIFGCYWRWYFFYFNVWLFVASKWKCNWFLYIGLYLSSVCSIFLTLRIVKVFLDPQSIYLTLIFVFVYCSVFLFACLFIFMPVGFFLRLMVFCEVFCEMGFLRVSLYHRSCVVLFYNQVFPINIKIKLEVWICFWDVSRNVVF